MFPRIRQAALAGAAFFTLSWGALADEPALLVHGAGKDAIKLSFADIRKLPSRRIRATPERGTAADYDCTPVATVLSFTGALPEKSLRGRRLAESLLIGAADGYQVVFALPEIDPEFTDRLVLLCYLKDGLALPAEEGPLRLVVPDEKRHARWVRMVTDFSVEKRP